MLLTPSHAGSPDCHQSCWHSCARDACALCSHSLKVHVSFRILSMLHLIRETQPNILYQCQSLCYLSSQVQACTQMRIAWSWALLLIQCLQVPLLGSLTGSALVAREPLDPLWAGLAAHMDPHSAALPCLCGRHARTRSRTGSTASPPVL